MNRILKFVRTTLVGGILFLLPLIVVVADTIGRRTGLPSGITS